MAGLHRPLPSFFPLSSHFAETDLVHLVVVEDAFVVEADAVVEVDVEAAAVECVAFVEVEAAAVVEPVAVVEAVAVVVADVENKKRRQIVLRSILTMTYP